MNSSLPTLRQALCVLSHFDDFVVYHNELNEDFSHVIATCGNWATVWKDSEDEAIMSKEIAEIHFVDGIVFVHLV